VAGESIYLLSKVPRKLGNFRDAALGRAKIISKHYKILILGLILFLQIKADRQAAIVS